MLCLLDSPQKEGAGCGKCHLTAQACWDMWDIKSMRISCETDTCHSPCKHTQARNTSLLCVLGKMQTQAREWAPKMGNWLFQRSPLSVQQDFAVTALPLGPKARCAVGEAQPCLLNTVSFQVALGPDELLSAVTGERCDVLGRGCSCYPTRASGRDRGRASPYKGGNIFTLCCFWTGNLFCFSGPDVMVLADASLFCKIVPGVDLGLRAAGAPQDS